MKKRAGSDRIGRKKPQAQAAAEGIVSPVHPISAAAPVPMPAVGARRSTRVFLPKATKPQTALGPAPARVLRSGKRLAFSGPLTRSSGDDAHWLRWPTRGAKNGFHVDDEDDDEKDVKPHSAAFSMDSPAPMKSFGIVYNRKRRRQAKEPKERRFGIVFKRKEKRSKVAPFGEETSNELATIPASSSREFASRVGFLEGDLLALVDGGADVGAVLLTVLVDTSFHRSSYMFFQFLVPVLRWIRRTSRGKVRKLASFILSSGVGHVFALHGLHFLTVQRRQACALSGDALLQCGWCEIYGAKKSVPLVSVNFSALSSYFQSLHSAIILGSMYLPAVIRRSLHFVGGDEETHPDSPLEADSMFPSTGDTEPTDELGGSGPSRVVQDYMPLEQVAGIVLHGLRLKKHQRKRSSSRHPPNRQRFSVRFLDKSVGTKQGAAASQLVGKPPLSHQESPVEPVRPKAALEISLDLLDNVDDSDVSTPMGSHGKQKRSALKSPVERVNERLALAEVRQNIESIRCKANLLIIQADRCWREEGAEVMLELSDSNEWCIAVKIQGITRIAHKPAEPRLCVFNRFTHAYIWAVDEGRKLEFTEKWDWLLFKELHVEGRERNSQGKMIPIPGVCEVSDDMEEIVTDPFLRPVPDYIRMVDDEVGRALTRDSIYDMDSDDEQWINQLNLSDSDGEGSRLDTISDVDFEKIITTLEKDAYNNPEESNDVGRVLSRYQGLGKDDSVRAVYKYWINKRNKKGVPLLRIFQVPPLRRGHLSQKSSFKKKRSFKRHRSQAGRGKPETFLQDNAEDEALQRVQEAEHAAKQAVERAIHLRSRAQALMANAELATYKSVMALRIAEAAGISDSSEDLASSILG